MIQYHPYEFRYLSNRCHTQTQFLFLFASTTICTFQVFSSRSTRKSSTFSLPLLIEAMMCMDSLEESSSPSLSHRMPEHGSIDRVRRLLVYRERAFYLFN